ncbi:MAG: SUMF1/EgtB/PvdO family nonheme iron enzyme [Bryobacteraceae bacterium]|nr:SUMF1/EgtB/PvdO family nonheme iron enzyme [Bryobacteraceae bacterium]
MSSVRNAVRAALHQLIGDKYEVLEWIGGGGMAEVFLAKHRAHGGLVAVKVLADSLSNEPRIVARFREEARTAATLQGHPNIVAIIDIGEGGGLHYLIMPYVDGEDLSRYLEQHGRLSNAETIFLARQIADALVWAADRGVVHRDLKPSNVRLDSSGRVMVLDFGISKATDVPTGLTTRGETLGTPYYMSPEQIRGETCDARSDLYSFGIILYELLAGRKPFTGDNLRIIELGHLELTPAELDADVHPVLRDLVARLLAKNREDRPGSPREVVETLRELGLGTAPRAIEARAPERPRVVTPPAPIPAPMPLMPEPPPAPQPPEPPKGFPGWLIPSFVGLVLLAGAGYWWSTRAPEAVKPERKAVTPTAQVAYPETVQDANGPLLLVAAGRFIFGDDSADSPNPWREMELPAYYVDATEVSNERYAKFVRATNRPPPGHPEFHTAPGLPVVQVTQDDAKAYCAWAGRRLPTEAEWEKAARGPHGHVYPWGNAPMKSPEQLVAVDDLPERQSPFRALNMAGNVFEWTVSPFPVTDREINDMQKLTAGQPVSRDWANIKGGSFMLKDERFFRLYMRRGWPVNQGSPMIGFRCVKDAKP